MNPLQSLPVVYALLLVDIAANWHVSPEELLADFGSLTNSIILATVPIYRHESLSRVI